MTTRPAPGRPAPPPPRRKAPTRPTPAALRLTVGGLIVGTLAAAMLVPSPSQPAPTAWQAVESTELVCPELGVPDGSASIVTALVAGQAAGTGSAGGAEATRTASRTAAADPETAPTATGDLRALDTGRLLARVPSPDDPVNLLVSTRSTAPIVSTATGSWAGAALAGVAGRDLDGEAAGLASTACSPPRTEWWFVGSGSRLGRRAALLVANASQEPASFDISLHARSGPVEALAGKGITLGPRSHVRLRLDALAEGEELLAVHVHATSGRVSAALRDVAPPVQDRPRGVDYLPPAAEPGLQLWIPGVPSGGRRRDLVLVNPGSQFASVSARLITANGTVDLPALTNLAVPAGSTISYALDPALGDSSGTLELSSDAPVTGAVNAVWGGAERRDFLWLAATPPLTSPNTVAGASVVPSGRGMRTTVTIAAPETPVHGALEVLVSADAATAPLGRGGALENGDLAEERALPDAPTGPVVITATTRRLKDQRVNVPAGTQATIELPSLEGGLLHLVWHAAADSGPALLAHRSIDTRRILATGYPWWPTVSRVPVSAVRADVGTLAPPG